MEVSYLVEEMDLGFWEEEGCCDGMHGCVAPALVVEATGFVEMIEVRQVL